MHATTPSRISLPIEELCRALVKNSQPRFLPVTPIPSAGADDCFAIVDRHVREHGGSVCYGWKIWEWPTVMVEAEFHAVWRDGEGKLRDLAPSPPPIQRILFLPDPARVHNGRRANNVRRPLSTRPDVADFISACDAEQALMNRGEWANEHRPNPGGDDEAEALQAIRQRKVEAFARIVAHLPRPGRNDPCFCGSGKKLKRCCGA